MAASESALPASVPPMPTDVAVFQALPVQDALRDLIGKAVGCAGNATGNGFAEDQEVRLQILCPRVTTRASTDRVSFVEDEQRAALARELAQRRMVAGLRMNDADIRQRRLGQHAGHITRGQRLFKRAEDR